MLSHAYTHSEILHNDAQCQSTKISHMTFQNLT